MLHLCDEEENLLKKNHEIEAIRENLTLKPQKTQLNETLNETLIMQVIVKFAKSQFLAQ